MINITIKNIPEKVYEQLKLSAKASHRSINSEVIYRLEKGLGTQDPQVLRRQIAEFRQKVALNGNISADEITRWKNEGRP